MPDRCSKMVDGPGITSYQCDSTPNHVGPCFSKEVDRSVRARVRWQEEQQAQQAHVASGLGEFQGQPQSTAQRYTDGATPVPGGEGDVGDHPGTVATRPGAVPAHQRVSSVFTSKEQEGIDKPPLPGGAVQDAFQQSHEIAEALHTDEEPLTALDCTGKADCPAKDHLYGCKRTALREREGDQRLPVDGFGPIAHEAVQADLQARLELGIGRYGKPLQAGNGRDSFKDAYEEVLDQSVYMRTLMIERDHYARVGRNLLTNQDLDDREALAEFVEAVVTWLEQ